VPYIGHKASYSTLGGAVVELKRDTRGIQTRYWGSAHYCWYSLHYWRL